MTFAGEEDEPTAQPKDNSEEASVDAQATTEGSEEAATVGDEVSEPSKKSSTAASEEIESFSERSTSQDDDQTSDNGILPPMSQVIY